MGGKEKPLKHTYFPTIKVKC